MSTRMMVLTFAATGWVIGWLIEPSIVSWLVRSVAGAFVALGPYDWVIARLQFAFGSGALFALALVGAMVGKFASIRLSTLLFLVAGLAVSALVALSLQDTIAQIEFMARSASRTSITSISIRALPTFGIPWAGAAVIAILATAAWLYHRRQHAGQSSIQQAA